MAPRTRPQHGAAPKLLLFSALAAMASVNGETDTAQPMQNGGSIPQDRSLQTSPMDPPCPTPDSSCNLAGIWNPFTCTCICVSGFQRVGTSECQHAGSLAVLAPNPWENCSDEDADLANNCPYFPVIHGRGEFDCEQRNEPGPGVFIVGFSLADCLCKYTGEPVACSEVSLTDTIFTSPSLAPTISSGPTLTPGPSSETSSPTSSSTTISSTTTIPTTNFPTLTSRTTNIPTSIPTTYIPTSSSTTISSTTTIPTTIIPTSSSTTISSTTTIPTTIIPTTIFPTTCEAPPLGCGYGIFSLDTCACVCAAGICPSFNGACYTACDTNPAPFSGCIDGVDGNCPWFPSTDELRCLSSPNVPTAVFTIYSTAGDCCSKHFGAVANCEIKSGSTSSPGGQPGNLKEEFYYPDLNGAENCVFDREWDDWMNLPGYPDSYLFPFEDASDCCELWYPNAAYCPQEVPSTSPSGSPTMTISPTIAPSDAPSSSPSAAPSGTPSAFPSSNPSSLPSSMPSNRPSSSPSAAPSGTPSAFPSSNPSSLPSSMPSNRPSSSPSMSPFQPSGAPSISAEPSPPPTTLTPTPAPTTPPPTPAPTTPPPTPAPTPGPTNIVPALQAGPWHIALDGNANCYNDDAYPSIWNGDQFMDQYLFTTAAECCRMWFQRDAECAIATRELQALALLDQAPQSDGPLLVQGNRAAPVDHPEPAALMWHVQENNVGETPHCSNDPNYPEAWDHPEYHHIYLFSTADLCCDFHFETKDCGIDTRGLDVGTPGKRELKAEKSNVNTNKVTVRESAQDIVTPKKKLRARGESKSSGAHHSKEEARRLADAYTHEELHRWYPTKAKKTCVNDGKTPEYMLLPGYPELFLFKTKADCCAQYDCTGSKLRTGRRR